jgi:uncharacterized protein YndB with AHSA1/START domain
VIALVVAVLMGLVVQAGEDRPLRHEVVVEAPVAEVWAAWTTQRGLESWLARNAKVDLKPGGRYETNAFGEIGEPGTVEMRVLAFEPERMLALSTSAPPDEFPEVAAAEDTWAVVSLYPVDETSTRVEYTMLGWREGAEWDKARKFFDQADRYLLEMLRRRFAGEHDRLLGERSTLRSISRSVEVDASQAIAWEAITTREALGLWLGDVGEVDLRFDGSIMIGSGNDATYERIIAYDPGRVLVTKLDIPERLEVTMGAVEDTWTVTRIEPVGAGRTRITRTMLGWGSGPKWTPAKLFFEATLKTQMRDLGRVLGQGRVAAGEGEDGQAVRGRAVLEAMRESFAGVWEAKVLDPDGVPTTVRNEIRPGPGGHGLVTTGWFVAFGRERLHASMLVWVNAGSGTTQFRSLDDQGGSASGEITLDGRRLVWDWRSVAADGSEDQYRVVMTADGDSSYRLEMFDGQGGLVVEAQFERVGAR